MNKDKFGKLMKSLKSIEAKLDIIIVLQKAVTPEPKIGKEENKILRLCDRKHTIDDIAKETGKKYNTVNAVLGILRKKGCIRSVRLKDRVVYERI